MYYLIVGPTCTGKDKIANYIVDNFSGFKTIISTTSRPIRPKEINGREYYFVTSDEFKRIISEDGFVEYRTYNTIVKGIPDNWYYGIEKSKVSEEYTDHVVVIDYKGAVKFAKYFGREKCVLVYVKSLYYERYIRNILRGDFDKSEWLRRNKEDSKWLSQAEKSADIIIENYGYEHPENPNHEDLGIDIIERERNENKNSFEDTKTNIGEILGHFSRRKI